MKVVNNKYYKCLVFLSMLYVVALVGTQLLVHKFVYFIHLDISASVLIFPLSFTLADIITEVYGFQISRQLLLSGLIAVLLFCLITIFLVNLPSSANSLHQEAFNQIFNPMLRSYTASFFATLIGGYVNIYCISRWRILLSGRYFWLRSIGSTLIGEGVFTLVAAPIIFLGTVPFSEIVMIAATSYIVKILYACVSSGPATAFVKLVRYLEKDNLEEMVFMNPFSRLKVES